MPDWPSLKFYEPLQEGLAALNTPSILIPTASRILHFLFPIPRLLLEAFPLEWPRIF
jgi:hypothetical protein